MSRGIFRYFTEVPGPEDVAQVENVRKGLHSMSYDRGRFFVDPARSYYSEHAVHHLQGLVYRQLRAHIQNAWRRDIEIEARSHRGESFLHLELEETGSFLNQSFLNIQEKK